MQKKISWSMHTFRLDRIDHVPDILPDPAIPTPDDYSVSEYCKRVFGFSGSIKIVGPQNVVAEYRKLFHKTFEDHTVDNNR